MASVYAKEVFRCEAKLRRLFMQQREQEAIAEVQSIVTPPTQVKQLLEQQLLMQANDDLVAENAGKMKVLEFEDDRVILGVLDRSQKILEEPNELLHRIKSRLGLNSDIAARIEVASRKYNVAVCRQVGSEFLGKLPRELRDMVHEYVIPAEVILCTMPSCATGVLHIHVTQRTRRVLRKKPEWSERTGDFIYEHVADQFAGNYDTDSDFDSDSHGHPDNDNPQGDKMIIPYITSSYGTHKKRFHRKAYWRDDILGIQNSHELIECFYRKSTFCLKGRCLENHAAEPKDVLSVLLEQDRFELGFQPAALISKLNIQLRLHASRWLTEAACNDQNENVQTWIKELHRLRKNAKIHIELIRLRKSMAQSWNKEALVIDSLMKTILPDLAQLKKAGYRVTVGLAPGWETENLGSALVNWLDLLDRSTDRSVSGVAS